MSTQQTEALPPAFLHYQPKKPALARVDFMPIATKSERGAGWVTVPLIGQPQAMPDLSQLTERGAKAWAGVDAQGLREGLTAADMATAAADGFRSAAAMVAKLKGERKVLWNLLGECLPVIDALMQIPGDDDSDAHLNGLAGRINDARTAVQAEELPGATP